MDPLSLLGAAAASAQFVGYAVQGALSIQKIWREVKDAPAGIEELLNHVDGEIASFNRLIDEKSPLAYQLSYEQRTHLAPFATDAAEAIKRMESILRPLAIELNQLKDQHGLQKRFQRSWAKIMTMKTLKDIKGNLDVVERLNRTLSRELEISGLITQSSLLDQSSQILTETSSMSTRLEMANKSIQDVQSLQLRAESTMSEKLGVLEQGSTNSAKLLSLIQDSVSDASVEISSQMQTGNELMMRLLSQNEQFRNEFALALSRPQNHTNLNRRGNTISSLPAPRLEGPKSLSRNSNTLLKCICKRRTTGSKSVGFPSQNDQTRVCPIHGPVRIWSYHATANLSPFLNGALELTLGFLTSRQGFSVLPPLRFRVKVKRSESHLFEWFDDSERILRQRAVAIRKQGISSEMTPWKPLSSRQLENITECVSYIVAGVRRSIELGLASGSDTDESGRNMLFEIFWLLVLLGPERIHVTQEILELLQLARLSDVDVGATTDLSTWTRSSPGVLTVSTAYLFYEHRLYDLDPEICREIANFDNLLETTQSRSDNDTDPKFLQLLLANPHVAEAADYPDFSMAIIRRSLPDTMRLAPKYKDVNNLRNQFWGPELALGWPEGLRVLCEQGFDVARGLHMAARLNDVESAKILLTTEAPIVFSNRTLNAATTHDDLISALAKIDNEVFSLYVEEIWRRASELRSLADPYLNADDFKQLGLLDNSSWFSTGVLGLLSQRMQLPHKLRDVLLCLPHYILAFTVGDERVGIHQLLYDIGWVDVDAGYEYGRTPLIELCRHSVANLYQELHGQKLQIWLESVLWFLEKGANPYFSASETKRLFWPHLQFYLAALYPTVVSVKSKTTRALRSRVLESCDAPVISDGCKCFCSTKGCIAPFLLWRCQPLGYDLNHANCYRRDRLKWVGLRDWVTAWKLSTIERRRSYREICRLELFDRLGGRHTCCARYKRICWEGEENEETDLAEELRQNKDEIAEFRFEDGLMAEQLSLAMYWYKQLQKVFRGMPLHTFWKIWWAMTDKVLLSLRAEEACRYPRWTVDLTCAGRLRIWPGKYLSMRKTESNKENFTQHREERWIDELERAGYETWDITDVINHHFAMCWLRARAYRHRQSSWKRHRLVGKPRFIMMERDKIRAHAAASAVPGWGSESDDAWV